MLKLCFDVQAAEGPGTARQDSLENLQSLYPLKEQLHATLQHVEGLLANAGHACHCHQEISTPAQSPL